jgi:hypothetical protein
MQLTSTNLSVHIRRLRSWQNFKLILIRMGISKTLFIREVFMREMIFLYQMHTILLNCRGSKLMCLPCKYLSASLSFVAVLCKILSLARECVESLLRATPVLTKFHLENLEFLRGGILVNVWWRGWWVNMPPRHASPNKRMTHAIDERFHANPIH